MYSFTIYYSTKFKLYDLTINYNKKFHSHYHLTKMSSINKLIQKYKNK